MAVDMVDTAADMVAVSDMDTAVVLHKSSKSSKKKPLNSHQAAAAVDGMVATLVVVVVVVFHRADLVAGMAGIKQNPFCQREATSRFQTEPNVQIDE